MTPDAGPVLIELADGLPPGRFQTRAVRGAIRIARQFTLSDHERADLCRAILKTAAAALGSFCSIAVAAALASASRPGIASASRATRSIAGLGYRGMNSSTAFRSVTVSWPRS